ncbi:MAG: neuA [Anaerocolumna sp.]|jgi:CMP-N,N'-diacetyllegionaminic acid synthase|nr:neuA [Anaerocolumna sp.]
MKHLAIIPARSGSKGVKDKNIKLLDGKPLMAYTIEAALLSGIYDEVHVSTDSLEYAEIAKNYGGKVPFLRSPVLSGDNSSTWDAIIEVIQKYESINMDFDLITLLQPTSPLRTCEDIKKAYDIFIMKNANSVVSICEVDHSPLWCNTLPQDLSMDNFIKKELLEKGRQKLDTYYRINGAIYMFSKEYFMKHKNIYHQNCYGYIMDKYHSVDIDDEMDFLIASTIVNKNNSSVN